MTVAITEFSVDKTKINWANDANSGADVLVNGLTHGQLPMAGGDDKTILQVVDDVADPDVISFYPMSGGINAQTLHRNHLLQDTLGNVQADATARGIDTTDKDQDQLVEEIIQDECMKKSCGYLLPAREDW